MKKLLSIILCLSLVAAGAIIFAACTDQNNDKEKGNENASKIESKIESSGEIVGGWTKAGSPVITDDFKKIFEKAVSDLDGVGYTPVAYLASQVVAGTNHCVLCKATPVVPDPKTTYSIVYIYEDLEGNAEITEIVSSNADAQNADIDVVGGWTEVDPPEMTDEARTALEKACETLTGAEYTPVALLATQVVAGTNYRIICESRPSIPSSETGYVIVTVYADLKGNAEITDTMEFPNKDNKGISEESKADNSGKTLVAYFSATGNTKNVAEQIVDCTNADIYEILAAQPYSDDDLNWHDSNSRATKEQNDKAFRPEIGSEKINLDGYDTIFIGFPIWWGEEPRIMDTFVESYDFSGKTVIPFCTSGSNPIDNAAEGLKTNAGSGDWKEGKRLNDEDIKSWIDSLDYLGG